MTQRSAECAGALALWKHLSVKHRILGRQRYPYVPKPSDTAGEITARRQSQAILCIMVELVRAGVLFSSNLAPRCEQIFPREFCSGEFASSIRSFVRGNDRRWPQPSGVAGEVTEADGGP